MIACETAERLIHLAEDGEANDEERALLADHCLMCSACAAAQVELVAVRRLIRASLPRPLPIALEAAFAKRLRIEEQRERYWEEAGRVARRWSRVAALVAVALGLAAAAAVKNRTPRSPAPAHVEAEDLAFQPLTQDATAELAFYGSPR